MSFFKRKFVVLVEGNNLLASLGEAPGKFGFFTTRRVSARNEEEAIRVAVQHVKNELKEKNLCLNREEDQPKIRVESVSLVDSFGSDPVPGSGFSFFPMDEQSARAAFPPLH